VQLERDAVFAGAGEVLARLQASGEADGLAVDEVLGGGGGLGLPDDQVDVDGLRVAVATVAGDRDVATVVPECVVRRATSRVRRPWPVRVIIAGPPGFRVVGG
jgi:hypothetical protein